jgi:tetratricopeptide (TPR) repeat protein
MEQIDRARELDPFNSLFQAMHAMDLHYARRYDDALALLRNTLTTTPSDLTTLATLRTTYHLLGRYDEATKMWKASLAAAGDREAEEVLDRGYAEEGYAGALIRLAELMIERSRTTHVTPWRIATLYTRACNHEEALHWLEQAYDAHDVNMPYIGVDPIFDGLRADPQLLDLLRRMNLPQ